MGPAPGVDVRGLAKDSDLDSVGGLESEGLGGNRMPFR